MLGLVCSHDCKEMERSSYHKCWGWFAAMTVRKWSVLVTTNVGLVCSHDCKEMERSSYHK